MDTATGALNEVISSFTAWSKQPFSSNMGAGGWFAFFGLILAISAGWAIILNDLKGEL